MKPTSENNPIRHTLNIKAQMRQLIDHLRDDVGKVTEPKARALFETSAEVITGLIKAFNDYEKKSEEAWRPQPVTSRPKGSSTRPQDDTFNHADKHKLQAGGGKKAVPSGSKTR